MAGEWVSAHDVLREHTQQVTEELDPRNRVPTMTQTQRDTVQLENCFNGDKLNLQWECPRCIYGYPSERALRIHIGVKHKEIIIREGAQVPELEYRCQRNECINREAFAGKRSFAMHKRWHTVEDKKKEKRQEGIAAPVSETPPIADDAVLRIDGKEVATYPLQVTGSHIIPTEHQQIMQVLNAIARRVERIEDMLVDMETANARNHTGATI